MSLAILPFFQGRRLPVRRREPESARRVHGRGDPLRLPGPEDGLRRMVRRRGHDQRPPGRRQGLQLERHSKDETTCYLAGKH